jgi:acetoin utilization deacetylase AcuC-like enzyme
MYIVYTERHRLHTSDQVTLEGAPFILEEVPARAEIILQALQAAGFGPVVAPTDHGLEPILAVHDAGFVEFLRTAYDWNAEFYEKAEPVFPWTFSTRHIGRKPKHLVGLTGYYAFGFGSPILEGTWEAAYWSAQCALSAADLVLAGERAAYALCRPPGHHAAADLYGGFCYLNNAAVAARYLQAGKEQVAVLDIDYHHGNGTQAIFYADPTVLYCSLHVHPDEGYPYYWGETSERGVGAGEGFNRNWPLPEGTDDARYLAALDEALAAIRDFAPRTLVVSVGFDIVAGDPVGGFEVTLEGLREVGQRIAGLGLPTLIVQEGGYRLESLGESAVVFLQAFVHAP